MNAKPNLVLVGFMGTGKTVAGRIAAARLGLDLVDMDEVIEARAGRRIPDIFAESGEAHFRRLERALAQELGGRSGLAVTAGGGVVLNPDNVLDLGRSGIVVCLRASPDVILARVAGETHRPLLENGEKRQRILDLLETRKPLYDAIPLQVDTSALTPEEAAARVIEIYEREAPRKAAGPAP
jgi:shikimate kinase